MNGKRIKSKVLQTAVYSILLALTLYITGCEDTVTDAIQDEVKLAKLPEYTLTILDPAVGSVTPSGEITVKDGIEYNITASVPSGFEFVKWYVKNGSDYLNISDENDSSIIVVVSGGDVMLWPEIISLSAPTGSISINSGATGTDQTMVNLTITGNSSTSTVTQMRIANSNDFSSVSWGTFDTSKSWTIDGSSNGIKTVYLQLKDDTGNISSIFSDSIIYDTSGPEACSIVINNGNLYYNWAEPSSGSVTLSLSANDAGVGVSEMIICNNSAFTGTGIGWEAYSSVKSGWDLDDGYGTKTVYVKYKDSLGNESVTYSDSIIIDDDYEGTSGNSSTTTAYSISAHHQGWSDINDPPVVTSLDDQELGGYGISNDVDYYKIELGDEAYYGKMTVTVEDVDDVSAGLTIRISGKWSTTVSTQTGTTAVAVADPVDDNDLPSGTYYFSVGSNNGFNSERYNLTIELDEYHGM